MTTFIVAKINQLYAGDGQITMGQQVIIRRALLVRFAVFIDLGLRVG